MLLYILIAIFWTGPHPPEADSKDDCRIHIEATWQDFIKAWESEDAVACSHIYTTNTALIPAQSPVLNGPSEIAAFYSMLFNNNKSSEYNHEIISLTCFDDAAIERGSFSVDWVRNDGTTWTFKARTLTHWVHSSEGWKIKTLMFNNPPE